MVVDFERAKATKEDQIKTLQELIERLQAGSVNVLSITYQFQY